MSRPYRICPDCGAALDPGEICDCQKQTEEVSAVNLPDPQELELLNRIIETAIDHGGDYGGAYYIAPTPLCNAMVRWLDFRGLRGQVEVEEKDVPRFELVTGGVTNDG